MAIPDGLKRISLGSTRPRRLPPTPPKSKNNEIRHRVFNSITHIAGMKTISPTSRSTNGSGYPHFVFTGYTFDDTSGTPHAGSTYIGSDIEFTINTVNYDSSYYTIEVNPTNITIDFTKEAFLINNIIETSDVVRLRARLKTSS